MTIEWNDNLKTGISKIDEQHKALFETAIKLDKSKEDESLFYSVLSDLKEYIYLHFSTEEEYMRYTDYPDYESHKACHDDFAKNLSEILKINSLNGSIMDSRFEIIEFVENWMTNHYSNEDVKMAEHLKK